MGMWPWELDHRAMEGGGLVQSILFYLEKRWHQDAIWEEGRRDVRLVSTQILTRIRRFTKTEECCIYHQSWSMRLDKNSNRPIITEECDQVLALVYSNMMVHMLLYMHYMGDKMHLELDIWMAEADVTLVGAFCDDFMLYSWKIRPLCGTEWSCEGGCYCLRILHPNNKKTRARKSKGAAC